ncbi:hypothetical protein SAMN06265222_10947 [Neorhodopirellula lusitana]|uniref:Uncharacterized protein n=1 Tax=Neorhodopirellula lusitana TaxID=445327 RepID=A0ABY1QAS0_9BACT|nr:hypothetical protein [Neorhodopirellula lusitana]SMP65438.1 hypothetical protein SAMN06265222_10947 [Neorhodopirellula lusitana]
MFLPRLSTCCPAVCLIASVWAMGGCQVLKPVPIPQAGYNIAPELMAANEKPVEIGQPQPIIDAIGWVWGIPDKILFWDRRVSRHKISEPTLLTVAEYVEENNLPHVKVRANQYAPLEDLKRLPKNKTVGWPYRYTLGVLSVAGEAILPGRIVGGDHFNPFTQTVHLYSDVPAIALHELGHAKDFTRRKWQGTYGLAYLVLPLWHETLASQDALAYLQAHGDNAGLAEANRILYPAYGTYVGGAIGDFVPDYAIPLYYGAVIAGHINGRMLNRKLPKSASQNAHVSAQSEWTENGSMIQLVSAINRTEFDWVSQDNALIADTQLIEDAPLFH